MRQLLYFVIYQRDICCVYGNVAANAAHSDAHICFFQGWSIIDAVPNHAHGFSCFLICANGIQFVLW